jgi:pyridoxal 5'-phosphate synthase pdxS subunit
VMATTHYDNPDMVSKASEGLGDAMPGLEISQIPAEEMMQGRGW